MYSVILNIIIFVIRAATLIVSAILFGNLVSEAREVKQEDRVNGLWATRIALLTVVGSVVLENLVYTIGYLHSLDFQSISINQWLSDARPFVILARAGTFYGIFKLFALFRKEHKK